jgi:hypothetical protein
MRPEPHVDRVGRSDHETAGGGDEILNRIAHAIRGVRYGAVEIVIQDSRVVQIERKEKFRFDKPTRF